MCRAPPPASSGESHCTAAEVGPTSEAITPEGGSGRVSTRSEMAPRVATLPVLVASSTLYISPGSSPCTVKEVSLWLRFSTCRTPERSKRVSLSPPPCEDSTEVSLRKLGSLDRLLWVPW